MKNTRRKISPPSNSDIIDEALRESFPASDPPAWTLGTERSDNKQKKSSRLVVARKLKRSRAL